MKQEKYVLWEEGEYQYPMAFGFVPNIRTYLHEDENIRPVMVVVPGGGYSVVSPTEGEIVAKKFYEKGYQTVVLTYTTNLLQMAPLGRQPMADLSRAIRLIRAHAEAFHIHPEKVVVCGFSAGGHLCASVCVHYEDIKEENPRYEAYSNRPNGAILAYPVISSGTLTHPGSMAALGEDPEGYFSLEKYVTAQTPPAFLWQTVEDELVPVENSYLYAKACREKGVKFAHHVFSTGRHGLSLANEDWAWNRFGEPYTMEQTYNLIEAVKADQIPLPSAVKKEVLTQLEPLTGDTSSQVPQGDVNEEVAIWPELAATWLKEIIG